MRKHLAVTAAAILIAALCGPSNAATPARRTVFSEALAQKDRTLTRYRDYLLVTSVNGDSLTRYYFSRPSHPAYPAWMRLTVRATGTTDRVVSCDTCKSNLKAVSNWYDWGKLQTASLRSALTGRRF